MDNNTYQNALFEKRSRDQRNAFHPELTAKDSMEYISRHIDEKLHHHSLVMKWDLAHFMESQYPGNNKAMLGSVITLTGSALCAQATTCSDYVSKTWPQHGPEIIALLERAINNEYGSIGSCLSPSIKVRFTLGLCYLNIFSRQKETVTEVFQQVIWMAAALRVAESDNLQYSNFHLVPDKFNVLGLHATFETTDLPQGEQSCWVPLLPTLSLPKVSR